VLAGPVGPRLGCALGGGERVLEAASGVWGCVLPGGAAVSITSAGTVGGWARLRKDAYLFMLPAEQTRLLCGRLEAVLTALGWI